MFCISNPFKQMNVEKHQVADVAVEEDMDNLALAFLERTNLSIKDLIGSGKKQKRFDEVPLELAGPYASEDADVTLQLNEKALFGSGEFDKITTTYE